MSNLTSRTTLTFLAAVSLTGCSLGGLRAGSSGGCPAGETCSSEAPDGLFFVGAAFSDEFFGASGVPPIAVGGSETVTTVTGLFASSPPFTGSFVATSADPAELTLERVTPPSFEAVGHAPGTDLVQLTQPGTTELLDEVDLQVEAISGVTVFPSELVFIEAVQAKPMPFVLFAGGGSIPLIVRLQGTGTARLVDQTISLTSAPGPVSPTPAWDLFDVTVPASPGQVPFSIQAGAGSFDATATAVDTIDTIELLTSLPASTALQVSIADGTEICFTALSGGALVAGANWAFSSSSGVIATATTTGCASVLGQAAGPATLTVTAGGATRTFDLTVVDGNVAGEKSASHRGSLRLAPQPVAGHRAEWLGAR
jgi:hypothetical protein